MRPELEEALRTAHRVAEAQERIIDDLEAALDANDVDQMVRCVRRLLGRDEDEREGHRPTSGVNRRPGGT